MADRPTVTAGTLADLFNLTERRVQQLANEKVVVKADRGKYDLIASVKGYVRFLQDMVNGSDASGTDLQRAKTEEALVSRDLKTVELHSRLEALVPVQLMEQLLEDAFSAARSEMVAAVGAIETNVNKNLRDHSIEHEVPRGLIEPPILDALAHLAARGEDSEEDAAA